MRHEDRVFAALGSRRMAARDRIAASWQRSAARYGLDPGADAPQHVASARELHTRREASERLLRIAGSKLDQLFGLVGSSGCAVVLTDGDGVILDTRQRDADAAAFSAWGLLPGADWSEAREGTNGIGTCLEEARSVVIHRDQHFFARNTAMSCIDTPIYGADGAIVGALDVSSARADQTQAINGLIAAQVAQTARRIEADNFRAAFPDARIAFAGAAEADKNALVAINQDDVIVGATRAARQMFGLGAHGPLEPMAATDLFARSDDLGPLERAEKAALVKALTRARGNATAAARALGIGRATLYRRMGRLGLDRRG